MLIAKEVAYKRLTVEWEEKKKHYLTNTATHPNAIKNKGKSVIEQDNEERMGRVGIMEDIERKRERDEKVCLPKKETKKRYRRSPICM